MKAAQVVVFADCSACLPAISSSSAGLLPSGIKK